MNQLPLLDDAHPLQHIVNVASVPQRSPFRYPGGKTWLVPRVRVWLASLAWRPRVFVEPFAGGGIVGLSAAFESLAEHVVMVERDPHVASVWRTILQGDAEWLAHAIESFDLNQATVAAELQRQPATLEEMAFHTILRNRTSRGGIMAPGAGRLKNGENGKGIASRWYPETLSRRIHAIVAIRERITFIEGDGLAVAQQYAHDPQIAFFIDPPYTASAKRAGSRLYLYSEVDHSELFRLASTFAGDFLMTYDVAQELYTLAAHYGFDTELVAMKNTHNAAMTELLIGRDLKWAR